MVHKIETFKSPTNGHQCPLFQNPPSLIILSSTLCQWRTTAFICHPSIIFSPFSLDRTLLPWPSPFATTLDWLHLLLIGWNLNASRQAMMKILLVATQTDTIRNLKGTCCQRLSWRMQFREERWWQKKQLLNPLFRDLHCFQTAVIPSHVFEERKWWLARKNCQSKKETISYWHGTESSKFLIASNEDFTFK